MDCYWDSLCLGESHIGITFFGSVETTLAKIHHGTRISVTFSGTPYDSIQTAGCSKNAGADGDLFGEHWPAGHAVGIPNMNPDPVEFVDNKHLYGICILDLPRK